GVVGARAARRAELLRALAPAFAKAGVLGKRLRPAYPRPGRLGWRRWIPSGRQWLGACLYLVVGMFGFVGVAYATTDIPDDLNSFATQQDNVFYWADGSKMARTGWVSRQEMPLDKVPKKVQGAVLSAENASFYSDPGVGAPPGGGAPICAAGRGGSRGGAPHPPPRLSKAHHKKKRPPGP
ncbi:penicillin-binding protein, partial [Streptomyces goshikiensis]